MVVVENRARPERKRRNIWIPIGIAAVIVLVAVIMAVVVWSRLDSVPVNFVNDTVQTAIISDCGPDLEQIGAGQTVVFNVNKQSQNCSFERLSGGNETTLGCLTLPSPLTANAVVRISDARPVARTHTCG